MKPEHIAAWNQRVTQFEVRSKPEKSDGPGDTYYFWTQLFSTLYYRSQRGLVARFADVAFSYGAPTMRFVRRFIARAPTPPHEHAAHLGKVVGVALTKRLRIPGLAASQS